MNKVNNFDLTVIYYTSNWLDTHNPFFLENTRKQLLKAAEGIPIISVSQKPIDFGKNICLGDIGRSILNIYRQILIGAKAAKTKYVAMAEDDILYSFEHFHEFVPTEDRFAYDMNKWSIYTWTNPPLFTFRNRRVVNSLIAKKDMLVESLQERFDKFKGVPDDQIPLSHWGDPGRYEKLLGVKVWETEEFYSPVPNIVFNHPEALGYMIGSHKKKKGELRAIEIPYWGRAEDMLKLYDYNQKMLWDNLARSNAKYYIYTKYGKGITEEQFMESGSKDYQQYITDDPLIEEGETILDIGCGIGRLLACMVKDPRFKKVVGVDISGAMIWEAQKRLGDLPNLQLIETSGYSFPLADNSIDFAFSYLVFQHFKTVEMLESNFREVYRVLKPQGLFKVRVRTDKADLSVWAGGVNCDEKVALSTGFKLIKKEFISKDRLWLWLEK